MHPGVLEREETLFERCWWLYALCREHLFTDHTHQIATALAPLLEQSPRRHLLEVGCGPGFYARRLAALFPESQITGVDLSEPLLLRARQQARRERLDNCSFLRADALTLTELPGQVDAVVASRLFLILAKRSLALRAIFEALRPGGVCFVAEPRSERRARVPLRLIQMVDHATSSPASRSASVCCSALSLAQFGDLLHGLPWREVRIWEDKGYLFAVCEKAA